MLIGIPKEIKSEEYRVGLTPYNAGELVRLGHQVMVERNAGVAIGFSDDHYRELGVDVIDNPSDIFAKAEMIIKVKEPQPSEYALLREDQILFTYLHLAPDPKQAQALIESGCTAIAYETVTGSRGGLPLLAPMSQVAGRLSIQAGAAALQKTHGGSGILLGGVPGVCPGKVVVIGGGVVGTNAVRMAIGKEAQVTVLEKSLYRLQELDFQFGSRLNTLYSSTANIREYVMDADLVIGAVLIPGGAAPRLFDRELLQHMRPGSVLVDVAIDQGGCFATSKATTHNDPTYVVDQVVHYCVANMPGAVPRTSTLALNNATMPFILELASQGLVDAVKSNKHLLNGVNVHQGQITHRGVAKDLGKEWVDPMDIIH
jgi:alanine dehydrogenase